MERGDIIALAAGIAIVAVIAVVLKFGGILPGGGQETPVAVRTPVPTQYSETPAVAVTTATLPVPTTATPVLTPTDPVPYRIYYTSKPLEYPVFKLPEHMETYGASEIPWKDPDIVDFAYIDESRSGLTQEFIVPYGVWGMNISVEAVHKPQYARFDMALCNATDGRYLDAMEILNPGGTAFRSVQVSHWNMYIIIHMENVDRFRITFMTPRAYYNAAAAGER